MLKVTTSLHEYTYVYMHMYMKSFNSETVVPSKQKILFGFCKQIWGQLFSFLLVFKCKGVFSCSVWSFWQLVTNLSATHHRMLELLEAWCLCLWENILFLETSLFWIYCKLLLIQIYKVVWHKHP